MKRIQIKNLIDRLRAEAARKIKEMGVDTEKTKKIVENSVFISTLNQIMETQHSQIFTFYFKHKILYAIFGN